MHIDTQRQLKWLVSRVGEHEGPNNDQPFGPWQGIAHAAWCDSYAQWGAVDGGTFDGWADPRCTCQFGAKGDAYVPFTIDHAKALGLWRAKGSGYVPQPGDQEPYDWNGNGVADHIGTRITTTRTDGTHVTIEGNHDDAVQYVTRDDTFVMGWVALSSVSQQTPTGPTPTPPTPAPNPKPPAQTPPRFPLPDGHWYGTPAKDSRNHSGYYSSSDRDGIKTFQEHLSKRGWGIGVSGVFDATTVRIVTQYQQECISEGLDPGCANNRPDASVGRKTWDLIWTKPVT